MQIQQRIVQKGDIIEYAGILKLPRNYYTSIEKMEIEKIEERNRSHFSTETKYT